MAAMAARRPASWSHPATRARLILTHVPCRRDAEQIPRRIRRPHVVERQFATGLFRRLAERGPCRRVTQCDKGAFGNLPDGAHTFAAARQRPVPTSLHDVPHGRGGHVAE